MKVTLDTNELINAFNFGGKALKIIHDGIEGDIELVTSDAIISETLRVLRERFEWQPYRLHFLGLKLRDICTVVEPKSVETVLADIPDNRILECAKESRSDCIITEDGAIRGLKEYEGIPIVTLQEFLNRGTRKR